MSHEPRPRYLNLLTNFAAMAGLPGSDDVAPAVELNKPCSEKHLAKISLSISDWRGISPFLDLTEADEQEILGAVPPLSVRSQKIAMLRLWKKKRGTKATYKRLCRAFNECEMSDLVEQVQKLLTESDSSSSDEGGEIASFLSV